MELAPDLDFCDECGAPLADPIQVISAAPAGTRKIVTILFADLIGSTALHERLDPESARRFVESYYALAREAVERHSGTLAKLLGDGAMAVFGIPRVAEDDAIRAVRAGVAMQAAFHALAEQQRSAIGETGLRVAVNTGEVVVKGETEIIGDPVNVAARLQERGRDGDVVIGESTRRLVASQVSLELLGSFDLKGRAEAVKAYRVVSLDAPDRAATTAFVGREEELARITAVASIEEYWQLAGDQELELGWHWPAYGRHGGLTVVRRFGTLPDGGAFESEYLEIFAVRHGRSTHLELFEIEDLDRTLARFEELRPQ